jgi:hypothetical protein
VIVTTKLASQFGVVGGAHLPQHGARLVFATPSDEPVRALPLKQHADEQQNGRDGGQAEHQSPVLARGKSVVDEIRRQDPGRDGELVKAHERTAELRRHDLADVQRNDHRCRADGQSSDHASDEECLEARSGRRQLYADDEDSRGDQDRVSAPDPVRHSTCAECAHDGAASGW